MQPEHIAAGASYVNASGRAERRVLQVGRELAPRSVAVLCVKTRTGKTVYGPESSKEPMLMSLYQFARWADRRVPESEAVG